MAIVHLAELAQRRDGHLALAVTHKLDAHHRSRFDAHQLA